MRFFCCSEFWNGVFHSREKCLRIISLQIEYEHKHLYFRRVIYPTNVSLLFRLSLYFKKEKVQTVWGENSLKKKLGIKPPYAPAFPLLGICPEDMKIEKDSSVQLLSHVQLFAMPCHGLRHTRPHCPSPTL